MRLDKYLKVSRLIKRRTVAKQVCDAGRIAINGKTAKAGSEVHTDDVIRIGYGAKMTEARVLKIAETIKANEADTMYEILNSTVKSEDEY